jgi:2-phospho-L-lactate guanylyltransferase
MSTSDPMSRPVVAVAAVKSLEHAKSRLGVQDPVRRAELVLAMLRDTLAAVLAAEPITAAFVASPDPTVLATVVESGGIPVPETRATGLNPALDIAAAMAAREHPGADLLAVQADLPALTPGELTEFLVAAAGRRAFAPDLLGTGTVVLLSPAGQPLRPAFGGGSAAAHALSATTVTGPWPGLHGDVDTAADLADRFDRVGRHTRAAWCGRPAGKCGPDVRSV